MKRRKGYNSCSSFAMLLMRHVRILSLVLTLAIVSGADANDTVNATVDGNTNEGEVQEPAVAVLFPWFALAIGTFTYLFLSRFVRWLPHTVSMFAIGTAIGIATVRLDRTTILTESVHDWLNIDSEVLLLVFLPGLVAKDAMQLDATLFRASFWQLILFAFPMVLAGTVLTALVCYYIFPYGWSFNLAMTMGSVRASSTNLSKGDHRRGSLVHSRRSKTLTHCCSFQLVFRSCPQPIRWPWQLSCRKSAHLLGFRFISQEKGMMTHDVYPVRCTRNEVQVLVETDTSRY